MIVVRTERWGGWDLEKVTSTYPLRIAQALIAVMIAKIILLYVVSSQAHRAEMGLDDYNSSAEFL